MWCAGRKLKILGILIVPHTSIGSQANIKGGALTSKATNTAHYMVIYDGFKSNQDDKELKETEARERQNQFRDKCQKERKNKTQDG